MGKRQNLFRSLLDRLRRKEENLELRELYAALLENNLDGMLVVNGENKIRYANKTASRLFHRKKPKELEGELFAFSPRPGEISEIEIASGENRLLSVEMRAMEIVWKGEAMRLVVLHQRSDHAQVRENLHKTSERLHILINTSPLAIIALDTAYRVSLWNRAAEKIFGCTEAELLGQNLLHKLSLEDSSLHRLLEGVLEGEQHTEYELSIQLAGAESCLHVSATPLREARGLISGAMLLVADVTALRSIEAQANYIVQHDVLTGLPNRLLFRDRLQQAIMLAQRRGTKGFALLHVDIDRFKEINQSFGHGAADLLLQEIGRRLQASCFEPDTVARLGGDEFLILAHNICSSQDAVVLCKKVLAALGQPFQLDGKNLYLTAGIGVAVYPNDGDDADLLLRNADSALHRAKEQGWNSFLFFCEEMNFHVRQKLELENDLRHALERGELELYYQPQVRLEDRAVTGVEVLIRWKHPHKGLISPDHFVPLAEQTGLIVPIGAWVLQQACRQHMAWRKLGLPPLCVAVNLSGVQFRHELQATVQQALAMSGMQPGYLELELTESMLLDKSGDMLKALGGLKQMGVRLSIDDFGTGYSSLSYLNSFPLDTLKIDRSFIAEAGKQAIVQAIVAMAHALGCAVVAEGVEQEGQLAWLQEMGCEHVQGYFFSPPLPAEKIAGFLMENIRQRMPVQLALTA